MSNGLRYLVEDRMKSLTWLAVSMLTDVHMLCATTPLRDTITVKRRIEHEGVSFLTITLPSFEKAFVRGLDRGKIASHDFEAFRSQRRGPLPRFLGGLVKLVFDERTGHILPNPSIQAISGIRQLCLFFKKVRMDCHPKREAAALRRFEECDAEIVPYRLCSVFHKNAVEAAAGPIISRLFGGKAGCEADGFFDVPRHGPGATAERVRGNSKYSSVRWWRNLDRTITFDKAAAVSGQILDGHENAVFASVVDELSPPVRVVTVPKTMKAPRVIAIEPVSMQYAQQGVASAIVRRLESHWLTSGFVNFSNQEVNRHAAITASRSRRFATIDLSEASDRVSGSLVSRIFRTVPELRRVLFGTRSARADLSQGSGDPSQGRHSPGQPQQGVPLGGRGAQCERSVHPPGSSGSLRTEEERGLPVGAGSLRLRKFAAMGSALCFPIESLCFYIICTAAMLGRRGHRPTEKNLRSLQGRLYIYGDDIIVHVDEVATVVEYLEALGLKVNSDKSFWTGGFRESCGMDAYDGAQVTPTYLRSLAPNSRRDAKELLSWVSTANQLYAGGLWRTCSAMRQHVESILGDLPFVQDGSPLLGWISFTGRQTVERWNSDLHRFEARGYIAKALRYDDPIDGYPALLKCLTTPFQEEVEHLKRSVRSGSVTLRSRWATPH